MNSPGLPHPPRHHSHLAARLQREWDRLAIQRRPMEIVRAWQLPCGPVDSLDDLLRRCGYSTADSARANQPQDGETPADAVLLALVGHAAHDFLAARIVLQRILPGLAGAARARGHNHPVATAAAFDELVGWSWQLIRTYPVTRRPRWVAANLVRDAVYQAFTRPARLRAPQHVLLGAEEPPAARREEEPMFELITLLGEAARQGVPESDIRLVARLVSAPTFLDAARELHLTERTMRNHRASAIHRLRSVAAA